MIYEYHPECKKGCDIDSVLETDIKNAHIQLKPKCPKCGRRIYPNEERTKIIGPKRAKPKYKRGPKKSMHEEIADRHEAKKASDGRRKRRKKKVA